MGSKSKRHKKHSWKASKFKLLLISGFRARLTRIWYSKLIVATESTVCLERMTRLIFLWATKYQPPRVKMITPNSVYVQSVEAIPIIRVLSISQGARMLTMIRPKSDVFDTIYKRIYGRRCRIWTKLGILIAAVNLQNTSMYSVDMIWLTIERIRWRNLPLMQIQVVNQAENGS